MQSRGHELIKTHVIGDIYHSYI